MNKFKDIGFIPCDILLPKAEDFSKWSVVACDQYTSQPDYWNKVSFVVGNAKSTLNMIYPEIYLNEKDGEKRIENINSSMKSYLEGGVFEKIENSFVYVKRTVAGGKVRHGLIGAIDLEKYDYEKGSKAHVRATEGTVKERIPPRVNIRRNASLELPHIMLLIDDPKDLVFGAVEKAQKSEVYDFDLMMNAGNIKGYKVEPTDEIANAFSELKNVQDESNTLLFAVGDGNHSLATAKECWNLIKANLSEDEAKVHPARYALVEVVNIHDKSLEFEPIHRIVFNADADCLLKELFDFYPSASFEKSESQNFDIVLNGEKKTIYIKQPEFELAVGSLQHFLDEYVKKHNQAEVDYIHGDDVVIDLSKKEKTVGFILSSMKKGDLFKSVKADGALPRKTFSMGEAFEKRFYLECRKITL
ncbi:MAG: DUF1015 domain-containing protein [Clostridia bacterium]|nr:DUF1015 domain-containing protein [Clostridia bacterium]